MENQRMLRTRTVAFSEPSASATAPGVRRGPGRPRKIPREGDVGRGLAGLDGHANRPPRHEEDEDEGDEDEREDEEDEEEDDEEDGEDDDDEPRQKADKGKGKAKKGDNQRTANKKKILRHLENFPSILLPIVATMPPKLNKAFESTRRRVRRIVVPDIETLLARIPPAVISDSWTQEMEDDLVAEFEQDPVRKYMASPWPVIQVHPSMWSLWRKCCHIRRVFPTDIIGPKHHTEYGIEANVGGFPDPNWDPNFCQALDILVFASPCNDNMDLLALFIRYAVACRIDDRQQVPMDDSHTEHPFFTVMQEQVRLAEGRRNLRMIGEEARQVWMSQDHSETWEMQVLENLEDMYLGDVEDEGEGRGAETTSLVPYKVDIQDLKALREAFEQVTDLGLPIFVDMEARYKLVCHSRPPGGAPENLGQLNNLRFALRLNDLRLQAQRRLPDIPADRSDTESWLGIGDGQGPDPMVIDGDDDDRTGGQSGEDLEMRNEDDDGFPPADDFPLVDTGMDIDGTGSEHESTSHAHVDAENISQPNSLPTQEDLLFNTKRGQVMAPGPQKYRRNVKFGGDECRAHNPVMASSDKTKVASRFTAGGTNGLARAIRAPSAKMLSRMME